MIKYEERFCDITEYVSVRHSATHVPYIYPHIHNYYEVYYNISGAKGYMVNGVFYKCSERDLIVIPKLQAHKVVIEKDYHRYERCIINIDDRLLSVLEIVYQSKESLDWLTSDNKLPKKTTLTETQHQELMRLIDTYNTQKTHEDALSMFAKILSFLRVCLADCKPPEYMDKEAISHTDRIMMIIEKEFNSISVSQIAERAHCNSDHLNRVFKMKMGITVKRYLVLRKLAEAQKYLCMGKSVKEACYLSGFNDYSNFLRTFKRYLGYTPGKFEGREKDN